MALDYDRAVPPSSNRQQPRVPSDASTAPGAVGSLAALVSRVLGRIEQHVSAQTRTRDAFDASDARTADTGRNAGKDQVDARAETGAPPKAAEAGRGADAANSDQAKALRAMMAARNAAPRQTLESVRDALAAAKKAPAASRDRDYGAER